MNQFATPKYYSTHKTTIVRVRGTSVEAQTVKCHREGQIYWYYLADSDIVYAEHELELAFAGNQQQIKYRFIDGVEATQANPVAKDKSKRMPDFLTEHEQAIKASKR